MLLGTRRIEPGFRQVQAGAVGKIEGTADLPVEGILVQAGAHAEKIEAAHGRQGGRCQHGGETVLPQVFDERIGGKDRA